MVHDVQVSESVLPESGHEVDRADIEGELDGPHREVRHVRAVEDPGIRAVETERPDAGLFEIGEEVVTLNAQDRAPVDVTPRD